MAATISRILLLTLVLAGSVLNGAPPGPGETPQRGTVVSIAKRDFVRRGLARKGLDLLMERNGRVYVVASPGDIASLGDARVRFRAETLGSPATPGPQALAEGGINGAYHSALELETELRALESGFPDMARVHVIGRTLEGRDILALQINGRLGLSPVAPSFLVLGAHHAREWISVEVPFLFGKHLLENYASDAAVRDIVDRSDIWIVPMVNPDGLEYSIHVYRYWRKNRRANADGTFGVDINRNYGYAWGFDDAGSSPAPGADDYRGAAPFSEPETAAVRDLFLSRSFRALVSFHSFGQDILYPWGYSPVPAPGRDVFADLGLKMSNLIAAVRGTLYGVGQSASFLYLTNGDLTDWALSVSGIPAFTIELPPLDVLHGGFFNAESDIQGVFGENLPALMDLARWAVDTPAAIPARSLRPRRTSADPVRTSAPKRIDKDPD